MLPKHSYFLINYFLVFPNLLLRLLFTAPKACDCEPCPPKATETSDHKVLSLFLPLVFPFSCGSLEFVLAFARSLIPQGPTLSAALRRAHRDCPEAHTNGLDLEQQIILMTNYLRDCPLL